MSTAARYNIVIERGSTFVMPMIWADGSTTPAVAYDLTGWTARMQIRHKIDDDDFVVEMTTENGVPPNIVIDGPEGKITVTIDATTTADLTIIRGFYDLEVIDPSQTTVKRLIEGRVKVNPEITR